MNEPVTFSGHHDYESNAEENSFPSSNHHDPIKDLEELVEETHASIVNGDGDANQEAQAPSNNTEADNYNCGYVQESISIDIQIPSDKVGLIIGKGGKTIKYFQEKCGARMNIIQRTTSSDEYDKILRIVGPLQYVEHGRQLVHDLICNAKDFKPHTPEQSESSTNLSTNPIMRGRAKEVLSQWKTIRYPVPRLAVGLIIGKGGETIRRIRMETGAKVRFDPVGSNVKEYDQQPAIVSGKSDQIRRACEYIDGLVSLALRGSPKHRPETTVKDSKFPEDEGPSTGSSKVMQDIDSDSMRTSHGTVTLSELSDPVASNHHQYILSNSKETLNQKEDGRRCPCTPYPCLNDAKQVQSECGQGEPNNPSPIYCCQHQHHLSSGTSIPIASFPVLNDHNSSRDSQTIMQFPMNSQNFPNWLDYFQPERQQAQADAWEQQVKAEEQQLYNNGQRACFNQECSDASQSGSRLPVSKSRSNLDEDANNDNPRESVTTSSSEQWSSEEYSADKPNCSELSTTFTQRSSNEKHSKLSNIQQQILVPDDESRPRDAMYPCQNPTCSQFTSNPGETMPNFPVNNNCFYPVLSPSARIITFYYDVNSNSVVVLNQWQCV